MPSSRAGVIPWVVKAMLCLKPRSVLDVGVGFGKYGFLAREYLDLWAGHDKPCDWALKLVGIEPFYDYLHYGLIYTDFYRCTLQSFVFEQDFDLVLCCDVLEHLELGVARVQIHRILGHCRYLLVTTPDGFRAQGGVFGNEFETHLCGFDLAFFEDNFSVERSAVIDGQLCVWLKGCVEG